VSLALAKGNGKGRTELTNWNKENNTSETPDINLTTSILSLKLAI